MIEFKESKILHTHLNNGALQGNTVFIKDNNLELLGGYQTIKAKKDITLRDGSIYNCTVGIEKFFKKGWYNNSLEFFGDITEQEQEEINSTLIF